MAKCKDYFSKGEMVLWSASAMVIIISFCVFDRINYMTLCASLIMVSWSFSRSEKRNDGKQ